MYVLQVKFYDKEVKETFGGILVDNKYIICGCCGGVIDIEDDTIEIIEKFDSWIDISESIMGDS